MTGLYTDPETGKTITTHSMVKTFRRCPKQTEYKYARRLKAKRQGAPLKRGVWMHELLEDHHGGKDWRKRHAALSTKFYEMFDEEREYYGNLPEIINTMMEAYEWHYAKDVWIVHETEVTLEAELPDGTLYRGKIDAIIENSLGLWLIDHKTHGRIPGLGFRLLDAQNALYVWAALKNKIPVQGFIWNYIRWKEPSVPRLVYKGTKREGLSKVLGDTDYPTYTRAIKAIKKEYPHFRITRDILDKQKYLKSLRYDPVANINASPFFVRSVLENDIGMVKQVVREAIHTSQRMHDYDFTGRDVERVPDRSCEYMCDYSELCQVELMGGNAKHLTRTLFKVGDPNDYYQDRVDEAVGMVS